MALLDRTSTQQDAIYAMAEIHRAQFHPCNARQDASHRRALVTFKQAPQASLYADRMPVTRFEALSYSMIISTPSDAVTKAIFISAMSCFQ